MTTPLDVKALRELALKATPGEWLVMLGQNCYDVSDDNEFPIAVLVDRGEQTEANAELIAAANPQTILALLDKLEAVEKERDELQAKYDRASQ